LPVVLAGSAFTGLALASADAPVLLVIFFFFLSKPAISYTRFPRLIVELWLAEEP
jgi:hypothetical protein